MVILHRYVKLTEGMLMSNGARFKNDYIFKNVEKQWKTHGTEVDCWLSAMGGRTNNIRDWTNLFGNISLGRFTLEPTNIEANNHYPIDRRSNLIKVDLRMGHTTICIYIESLFQSLCECHETIVFATFSEDLSVGKCQNKPSTAQKMALGKPSNTNKHSEIGFFDVARKTCDKVQPC